MNEQEAISRMVAPGTRRKGKYREGVIQIWVTRHCDKACFGCTQGSNLRHLTRTHNLDDRRLVQDFITPEQFEQAVLSLKGYFGVVGVFGGNPAIHPQFAELCAIMRKHVPYNQRGLWCNNPLTAANAMVMRETFDPSVSNLNVHLDETAYRLFKEGWPECHPVGLHEDSRHSPPYVAMKDVVKKDCPDCDGGRSIDSPEMCYLCGGTGKVIDESRIWELVSDCDINKHWSAMIGVFRGELRAWFCEIAGAQAMLHQHEPDYPDTGIDLENPNAYAGKSECVYYPHDDSLSIHRRRLAWWEYPMGAFVNQVRKHCFDCGIPLRGKGELAQSTSPGSKEQVSATHAEVYKPKRPQRPVEVVTDLQQLGTDRLGNVVRYIQNSKL